MVLLFLLSFQFFTCFAGLLIVAYLLDMAFDDIIVIFTRNSSKMFKLFHKGLTGSSSCNKRKVGKSGKLFKAEIIPERSEFLEANFGC